MSHGTRTLTYFLLCRSFHGSPTLVHDCTLDRAPDGQSLMLASADGYCSIVIFDEFLPLYHTQQHHMQLQAIAHSVSTPQHTHHSLPAWTAPPEGNTTAGISVATQPGPLLLKRNELPTPADEEGPTPTKATVEGTSVSSTTVVTPDEEDGQPRKKKRRIQLTHHGDIE